MVAVPMIAASVNAGGAGHRLGGAPSPAASRRSVTVGSPQRIPRLRNRPIPQRCGLAGIVQFEFDGLEVDDHGRGTFREGVDERVA
jgi:hypothetical protein